MGRKFLSMMISEGEKKSYNGKCFFLHTHFKKEKGRGEVAKTNPLIILLARRGEKLKKLYK